jgi:hypothetical protein
MDQQQGSKIVKSKGQGKKEFVVMQYNDYINEWQAWSVPVTIKQAYFILARKNPKYYKIEVIK